MPRPPAEKAIGVLTLALLVLAAGLLATWIPHYLTWPWWPDVDTYAAASLGWEHGVLPYRDVVIFNFPGQIYLHWVVGKVFGWGHTAPIYAVDAGLLIALGIALAIWSQRRFGRALPGLVGFVAILEVYLNLDYSQVFQRDWQGPALAALAIMCAQVAPNRWGRFGSALAFAAGLSIRPHAGLFLPAVLLALDDGARPSGGPLSQTFRPLVEWTLAFCAFLTLAMAPLLAFGILDDLVRHLGTIKHRPLYSRVSWGDWWRIFRDQYSGGRIALVLGTNLLLATFSGAKARRATIPWLAALLLASAYRPFHPLQHAYLALPLKLYLALNIGLCVALILTLRIPASWFQVAAIAIVLALDWDGLPAYCRPQESLEAWKHRNTPGESPRLPPGAEGYFGTQWPSGFYSWNDYRRTLAYLRRATGPKTRIANVIRNRPFLTFNGPVGRVTPFPGDTGILWLWQVDPGMEGDYVAALERSRDSVVVWVPNEFGFDARLHLPVLAAAVHRFYRPEARFGSLEVWRRRTD